MKTFKEVAEDIVNKMEEGVIPNTQSAKQKLYNKYIKMGKHPDAAAELVAAAVSEDAPANAVGTGANVALPPAVEPGVKKKDDDKRDPLMFGKYKTFKRKLKENNDNNNIMLKQVLDSIDRVEQKIDEKNGFENAEVTIEAEKEYVTFRDKYKA
jgi:hypothetical protein